MLSWLEGSVRVCRFDGIPSSLLCGWSALHALWSLLLAMCEVAKPVRAEPCGVAAIRRMAVLMKRGNEGTVIDCEGACATMRAATLHRTKCHVLRHPT